MSTLFLACTNLVSLQSLQLATMSTHLRSTRLGTGLEDPFISNSGQSRSLAIQKSKRVPSEDGEILSDEEDDPNSGQSRSLAIQKSKRVPSKDGEILSDEEPDQSSAQTTAVFGTAPIQSKIPSAVKLPAAPSSRNYYSPLAMPEVDHEMRRQRVWSNNISALSASAAPFVPNALAQGNGGGTKVESDSRKDSRLFDLTDDDIKPSLPGHRNLRADERLHIKKRRGKNGPSAINNVQDRPPQYDSRFPHQADQTTQVAEELYTPPSSSTDRVLHAAQENRRNAFSDETNLYGRRAIVHALNCQNPHGYLDCTEIQLPRNFPSRRPPEISNLGRSSQHAPYSVPQLPSQISCYVSTPSNQKSHIFGCTDDSLDDLKQGPFHAGQNGDSNQSSMFDHYTPTPAIPHNHVSNQPQINPYAHDGNTMGSGNYFTGSSNYPQQVRVILLPIPFKHRL